MGLQVWALLGEDVRWDGRALDGRHDEAEGEAEQAGRQTCGGVGMKGAMILAWQSGRWEGRGRVMRRMHGSPIQRGRRAA